MKVKLKKNKEKLGTWALDTNQEEWDKGQTAEVGLCLFMKQKRSISQFLDASGHESFVPNMVGSTSQAD